MTRARGELPRLYLLRVLDQHFIKDREDLYRLTYICAMHSAETDFGIIGRLIPAIDREASPTQAVEEEPQPAADEQFA